VIVLTKAIAKYTAPYNIIVNCVSPVMIDTNMTRNCSKKLTDQQINNISLKRFRKADENCSSNHIFSFFKSGIYYNFLFEEIIYKKRLKRRN
jgi:NAD(P)-dependent dehydrogenase (short-subunit alcohol dehydrogenase family)